MKTAVLTVAALSLAVASSVPAQAGDREWATAGKVLTGVVAAGVIAEAFRPHYPPTVVYQAAPPAVVCAPAPARVVYAPQPQTVVYYPAPPAQVVYVPASPVYYAPAPCYRPRHAHPRYAHVHFGGRW